MAKRSQKNLEADFWRSVYRDTVAVPEVLLAHYRELGLGDADMITLLRMIAGQNRQGVLQREELLRRFVGEEQELLHMLAVFEQRGLLTRQVAESGVEVYTLDGLYEKLLELWVFRKTVPGAANSAVKRDVGEAGSDVTRHIAAVSVSEREAVRAVYSLFEGEFARPLSPTEIEKLNYWLIGERWDVRMLKEALSRAVMHGALSFAYIDKILFRWQRAGISTPEQLAAAEANTEPEQDSRQRAGQNRQGRPGRNQGKVSDKISDRSSERNSERNSGKNRSGGYVGATDYSKYF